jgi:UDP-N-acetylglucosamine 4,6-dehydratase
MSILITGGTGSFGNKFVELMLRDYHPKRLVVISRDEMKQYEMQKTLNAPCMRYFVGDVRDRDRLYRAFVGVDIIIHAAALKQVPTAEYNPFEFVKTNVIGAQNVIDAAIDCGVKKVVALSTDKATNPINLYGATKLCSDKLFIAANSYSGYSGTRFSIVRYGNVVGSRGSVIPFFQEQSRTGRIPITDERMTRFWITMQQGVNFVMQCLEQMSGGEIFVPKIPSMKLLDLARAIAPSCEYDFIGIRPGEKLHEVMIPEDEARNTLEYDNHYRILPAFPLWSTKDYPKNGGQPVSDRFRYSSDTNDHWLTVEELQVMAQDENTY